MSHEETPTDRSVEAIAQELMFQILGVSRELGEDIIASALRQAEARGWDACQKAAIRELNRIEYFDSANAIRALPNLSEEEM